MIRYSRVLVMTLTLFTVTMVNGSSLNVVTSSTDSVMGNAVARHFGQMLYLGEYSVRSDIMINERVVSGNTSEISLETPLRVVSRYKFNTKNQRKWTEPQLVAQNFIDAAQEEGLLAIN